MENGRRNLTTRIDTIVKDVAFITEYKQTSRHLTGLFLDVQTLKRIKFCW